MKNKYYTPEIEEFHVGFEYQIKLGSSENELWRKSTVSIGTYDTYASGDFMDETSYLIPNAKLRVKYLDREDIESLGFIRMDERFPEYINEGFIITNLVLSGLDYYRISNGRDKRFEGDIKNKSELQMILKMVGHG